MNRNRPATIALLFAKRIEKAVFLNDLHFKIALTGFEEFNRWALKGVVLPEKAEVSQTMYWKGIQY